MATPGARKQSKSRMIDTSTIIMISAALVLFTFAYMKSSDSAFQGLRLTRDLLMQVTPRLLAAFVIAGMVQVLVPQEVVVSWMGTESGFKGILIGTALGGLTPGGPMTHFPILASFYQMGIGVGPLIAYLTAWLLFGLQRVVMWELPFLGTDIVVVRLASSFFIPVFAGWLSGILWSRWHPS